jgi:hypothetical protein
MKAINTENWNNYIRYVQATETAMRRTAVVQENFGPPSFN